MCSACTGKAKAAQAALFERRRGAGVCRRCGVNPSVAGCLMCAPCAEQQRAGHQMRRKGRTSKGLCAQCGERPRDRGTTKCAECNEAYRAWRQAKIDAGACVTCGSAPAVEGNTRCAKCHKSSNRASEERRALGLCAACGEVPHSPGKTTCDSCLTRKAERYVFQRYRLTRAELDALVLAQRGECAICGRTNAGRTGVVERLCGLHIDHDHRAGRVRGLLCHHCNLILGHADDSVERLERATQYLRGKADRKPARPLLRNGAFNFRAGVSK